jgi:hypothetical protein
MHLLPILKNKAKYDIIKLEELIFYFQNLING